jgi:predicted house-cleaning noncanonical NTP pyrophosphatase (MazG superfamily)
VAGKVYYRKLIRDKIPEKIASAGATCSVRTLSPEEYESALLAKVEEEASGVAAATSRAVLIDELADVLAVIQEIRLFRDISDEELEAAYRKGFEKKGGFTKRLFLEWSSDDGYTSNEKKG